MYIAGNIAAGKSTVSRLLRPPLEATLLMEAPESNPYLSSFYSDMPRWSFHTDVHFLASRAADVVREYRPGGRTAIFDRCFLEGEVFADTAHALKLTTDVEAATFNLLLRSFAQALPPPAVLIYLHAEPRTLMERVSSREREYEKSINLAYISALQRGYDKWFNAYATSPKVFFDTSTHDVREDEYALPYLLKQISAYVLDQ